MLSWHHRHSSSDGIVASSQMSYAQEDIEYGTSHQELSFTQSNRLTIRATQKRIDFWGGQSTLLKQESGMLSGALKARVGLAVGWFLVNPCASLPEVNTEPFQLSTRDSKHY